MLETGRGSPGKHFGLALAKALRELLSSFGILCFPGHWTLDISHSMKVLFIGDVVGKPGRAAVAALAPRLRRERKIDLVIANGENSAHGAGLTASTVSALLGSGVDVITSGDHIWDQKEVYDVIEREPRLLRPLNMPPSAPG